VAEEQLAVLAGAAAGAVAPGGFGAGAVAAAAGRRPGEGFHVGPVHGQRRAGVGELTGDGCLEQPVADPGEGLRWQAVGCVLGQGACDQAEGALGRPVGEQVRAGLPVLRDAEPDLVGLGQAGERVADPGQVRGPLIGLGQQHPGQQGADPQLPVAHPGGQQGLDPRRDAGGVDDLLQRGQRGAHRVAPSSATAVASSAGLRAASRSPSRWEQVIPAACMNVARPSRSATSASQVARSRPVSSRGSPAPPDSDRISGVVMLRRPGRCRR
jgi:hypothetical protein